MPPSENLEATADRFDKPLVFRLLSDHAYEAVLTLIASEEFALGSRMPTEEVLSKRLGVSRPILRQALKQLRNDEIIVSRQGSGSFVNKRPAGATLNLAPVETIADIDKIFEFRAALESEAACLAAQHRTDSHIGDIRSALDALDRSADMGDIGVQADEAFHEAIFQASANKYFSTARSSMRENILNGMKLAHSSSFAATRARLQVVRQEHYAILMAISAGDPVAARVAMRAHIMNVRDRLFKDELP